jgi:MerR family transcriptional regulator/heat shock protein HspR
MGTRKDGRRVSPLGGVDFDAPVYIISVAAELTGLHPQTLRTYDRLGLVSPGRSGGGGRMYSMRDIETLRHVTELSASGIGLEGVRRILELEAEVEDLREQIAAMSMTRMPAPVPDSPYPVERMPQHSTAVVLWGRKRK